MDAFRIALTEELRLFIKQKHGQDRLGSLFYYHPPIQKPFHFNTLEVQIRF